MTFSAVVRQSIYPVRPWTPPLSGGELATVLDRLRGWTAFDGGALIDDVAAALDDVPPTEGDTEELAERLRGHLMRLVTVAVAAEADQDAAAAQLVERARTLGAGALPGERRMAVGNLRRMGWTAGELLERLVALRCLREVA
ncbi:DUF6415 family natural product biosynthesis protein [Streptomyces pilosus]|uniref:DUF6415 family natural product biosynthesis protein n=1 Tax=Streptomyces pilosus TaxID=28893 RepID=UPI003639A97D